MCGNDGGSYGMENDEEKYEENDPVVSRLVKGLNRCPTLP